MTRADKNINNLVVLSRVGYNRLTNDIGEAVHRENGKVAQFTSDFEPLELAQHLPPGEYVLERYEMRISVTAPDNGIEEPNVPIDVIDKNIAPTLIRTMPPIPVGNGDLISFNIGRSIAGGLADAEHNPSYILNAPSGLSVDTSSGEVSGVLAPDTLHIVEIGVNNDLGEPVFHTFNIPVGNTNPVTPPSPEAAPALGSLWVRPVAGGVGISWPLDTETWQLERRVVDITQGEEDNWVDVGTQAATDTDYIDTTVAADEAYEYRLTATIGGNAVSTGTDVAWESTNPRTMVDDNPGTMLGDITVTDGPMVVVINKPTGATTMALDGVVILNSVGFELTVHAENGANQIVDAPPSTIEIDPVFADSGIVGLHYEFEPEFQRWVDLKFFTGKPLLRWHQVPRWNRKNSTYATYSSELETLFKVTDAKFKLAPVGVTDAANAWQQRDSLWGGNKEDPNMFRSGAHQLNEEVTDLGTSTGGRIIAAQESTNGIPSGWTMNNDSTLLKRLTEYSEHLFSGPLNVEELRHSYGAPVNDAAFYATTDRPYFVLYFGDNSTLVVEPAAAQNPAGEIDALIGGPYNNLIKVRQYAPQNRYGQVSLFGTISCFVGGEVIAKSGISFLSDNILQCAPYSFSVRDLSQNNPSEVYSTVNEIGHVVAYPVANQEDYMSCSPGCGPIVDCAFGVGTVTTDNAFRMPAAQTEAEAEAIMYPAIYRKPTAGDSGTATDIVNNIGPGLVKRTEKETMLRCWTAFGDTENNRPATYNGAVDAASQHQQGGSVENALFLWHHTPTQTHWDLFQRNMDFLSKAIMLDYPVRNHRLGAMCRKAETTPRYLYNQGEVQDGYRHSPLPLSFAAELTGFRYYKDALLRACGGAAIVGSRDTSRNYYKGIWSREVALIYTGLLVGHLKYGNVHPYFDGAAPTNLRSTPNDHAVPADQTYLDVLNLYFDTAYDDIAARVGTGPKFWGAGIKLKDPNNSSEKQLTGQPVWESWSMPALGCYHDVLLAEGDTARAAKVYEVIDGSADKYLRDYVRGTGFNELQFAYTTVLNLNGGNDPIDVTSWRNAGRVSEAFASYFAELFAVAGRITGNQTYTDKSLEIYQTYANNFKTTQYGARSATAIFKGLGNLIEAHGDNL